MLDISKKEIYSIGHSDLPIENLLGLISNAKITAIADVRSSPYSRRFPWFGRHELKAALSGAGISYAFVGLELGGRPADQRLFDANGVADYSSMSKTSLFESGLERISNGMAKYRIAMLCSERDPLHCHRCLMVGRTLLQRDINTLHIHHNGHLESQLEAQGRLLMEERLDADDFLRPIEGRLNEAYDRRRKRVAFGSDISKGSI